MKKILIFLAMAAVAASCLNSGTSSWSDRIFTTFDYSESTYRDQFGEDSLYFSPEYNNFVGDPFAFYCKTVKESSEFKGGFLLSCLSVPASGVTDGLQYNEYRSQDTLKVNGYAVFHQTDVMPERHMEFVYSSGPQNTCAIKFCYVNNTVAVVNAVNSTFVVGDKLTLKAKGYRQGKEPVTAEYVLAEKTDVKDSVVTNWREFRLEEKLGNVDYINFELIAPEGKDIPLTFCIDNILSTVSLSY